MLQLEAMYWDTGKPILVNIEVNSGERIEFIPSWRVLMAWIEVVPTAENE